MLENLFKLFVLNCALRNGDAHLKNFGVIYEDVTGPSALSAEGWHGAYAKRFHGLARPQIISSSGPIRCDLFVQMIKEIIEQTADVLASLTAEVTKYFDENSSQREIGNRLLAAWQTGVRESLGFSRGSLV